MRKIRTQQFQSQYLIGYVRETHIQSESERHTERGLTKKKNRREEKTSGKSAQARRAADILYLLSWNYTIIILL